MSPFKKTLIALWIIIPTHDRLHTRLNLFNPLTYLFLFFYSFFGALAEAWNTFYGLFAGTIREGVTDYKKSKKSDEI